MVGFAWLLDFVTSIIISTQCLRLRIYEYSLVYIYIHTVQLYFMLFSINLFLHTVWCKYWFNNGKDICLNSCLGCQKLKHSKNSLSVCLNETDMPILKATFMSLTVPKQRFIAICCLNFDMFLLSEWLMGHSMQILVLFHSFFAAILL